MNIVQKIIKNTLSLAVAGIITQGCVFSAFLFIARVMGPENFGKINFAIAITVYFAIFSNFGLTVLGSRDIARDFSKTRDYLNNIVTLRVAMALVSFLFLIFIAFFLNVSSEIKGLIILYGLTLFPMAFILDWAFQGLGKMEYVGAGRVIFGLLFAFFIFSFVKTGKSIFIIPVFESFARLVAAVLLMVIFSRKYTIPAPAFDFKLWKNSLKETAPIGISMLLIQVLYNADTVMIGFMKDDVSVGYYTAAYRIILLIIMAGSVYFDSLFPVISSFFKNSHDSLMEVQSHSAKLMVTLAFPIAILGFMLAKYIMNMFYGLEYDNGVTSFRFLVLSAAVVFPSMVYSRGLWACNRQKYFLIIITFQAISNIILNFFLIPMMGIAGAAIATLLTEIAGLIFYYIGFKKVVNVPFVPYIPPAAISGGFMAIFIILFERSFAIDNVFLVIPALGIYIGTFILLKGTSLREIKLLYAMITSRKG